mgnify:CR=1 FL=1
MIQLPVDKLRGYILDRQYQLNKKLLSPQTDHQETTLLRGKHSELTVFLRAIEDGTIANSESRSV